MKGLEVSTIGTPLEVHMRVHELRADVVHVIRHAAQDGVRHGLGAVAALFLVAVELLDPLQVDDRHHADQQVRVLGDVDLGRNHGAVQAFIEQQIGVGRNVFPGREGTRLLFVGRGLLHVVQVLATLAGAGGPVVAEQRLQLGKQVVLGSEMAEVVVACLFSFGRLELHLLAVVPVEAVAFDDGCVHVFSAEDVLEGARHRGGTRARRTGNRDDGMAF
jgi:hypothetical protein